ncbi:PilZ domain-containing protein [Pseudomaricurvus alkylphenolicus]|uniref:PilZ domain-containing protein n=1 Tax=Pseudomaricurvus alkylphenolicus TaxID=1306991 RepID=UPI00141D88C7|nr:PilZ domain-containing protein [Pseudomaricurvus alkylphenolicus]NIB44175.1 PilZ domain-containing protein [Pseudomaricurvus alkylphenolicus]
MMCNPQLKTTALNEVITLDDLRRHVRVSLHCKAEVATEEGEVLTALVTDVSRSGIGLSGDRHFIETLLPKFRRPDRHLPVEFTVYFILPDDNLHCEEIKISCSSVYVRRLGVDAYGLGAQFVQFLEGDAALAEYLVQREMASSA